MSDPGVDWRTIAVSACTLVTTIVGFLITGVRSEMRRQAEKLVEIDRKYVDRTELQREIAEIVGRMEARHAENKEALRLINQKLDVNSERDSQTRHDIRESVHTFVTQSRLLIEYLKRDPR